MKAKTVSKVEVFKAESRGLRGEIAEELASPRDHVNEGTSQLLKFHGVYQQDDRDRRKEMRQAGGDKAYQFMVRTKTPGGGRLTPEQWLVLDEAAERFGNGTMRVTTRQDIQFHGVGKTLLREAVGFLNREWISTWGACGDGVRNTMACPVSGLAGSPGFNGQDWAARISRQFTPRSTAYFEVWLDGENVTPVVDEPLFGKTYLPRKFKIAISEPDHNCVDVHTNDVGLIPRVQGGRLLGFLALVGGGMGSTHGKSETFPRLATPFTFVEPDSVLDLLEAIILTHRDLGDRVNRKHARLKYIVEDLGLSRFRTLVEERFHRPILASGFTAPLGEIDFHLGWHSQVNRDYKYLGIFVENGRIQDSDGVRLKTGLREVVTRFRPSALLTPAQNVILSDLPAAQADQLEAALKSFGIETGNAESPLRRNSLACPALPTCGLAIAEAERFLPDLLSELEALGYGNEGIMIRMSGCPNSCSRPPVAEIGLVGKSMRGYHVYVGGSRLGNRLGELFQEDVRSEDLASTLATLLDGYRAGREGGEGFGDFAHRIGVAGLRALTEGAPRTRVGRR